MARKKDKLPGEGIDNQEELNLDDLDSALDSDNDDIFGDEEEIKDSRKPTGFSVREVAARVKPDAEMARQAGQKIGNEYRHIGKGLDSTVDLVGEVQRMKDDLLKDLSPSMNRLKNVSKKFPYKRPKS